MITTPAFPWVCLTGVSDQTQVPLCKEHQIGGDVKPRVQALTVTLIKVYLQPQRCVIRLAGRGTIVYYAASGHSALG